MTDRDVDAAVALLTVNAPGRECIANADALDGISREEQKAIITVCTALAEANDRVKAQAQEIARQVEETTRERTWCQAVAAQLKAAERQLAAQMREIVGLREQFSEVSANWYDALGTIRAQAQEIARLKTW